MFHLDRTPVDGCAGPLRGSLPSHLINTPFHPILFRFSARSHVVAICLVASSPSCVDLFEASLCCTSKPLGVGCWTLGGIQFRCLCIRVDTWLPKAEIEPLRQPFTPLQRATIEPVQTSGGLPQRSLEVIDFARISGWRAIAIRACFWRMPTCSSARAKQGGRQREFHDRQRIHRLILRPA